MINNEWFSTKTKTFDEVRFSRPQSRIFRLEKPDTEKYKTIFCVCVWISSPPTASIMFNLKKKIEEKRKADSGSPQAADAPVKQVAASDLILRKGFAFFRFDCFLSNTL
jgi:hypothetical protein